MCTSSSWWGHRRRWCPTPSRNGKGGRARPGAGTHHGVSISRLVPLLGSFGCAGLYAGARFGKARGDACAVPNRRRSGRRPTCRARDALAPALVRTSTKCEIARPRSPAAGLRLPPRSPAAGRAGSRADSQAVAPRPLLCSLVAGGTWFLMRRLHTCSRRRRRCSGRRPAHSSRVALAPMLACTSVGCEAARVRSQAAALWPSPCSPVAGGAGSHAGARLGEMRGCTGVAPPQAFQTAPAP